MSETKAAGLPMTLLTDNDADFGTGTDVVRLPEPRRALAAMAALQPVDDTLDPAFATDLTGAEQKALRLLGRDEAFTAAWRGLLAMCLLLDVWEPLQGEELPSLRVESYRQGTSDYVDALIAALPRSRRAEGFDVLALQSGREMRPLGLLSGRCALIPGAVRPELDGLLPAQLSWYDPETRSFTDPTPGLCETDRRVLRERLTRLQTVIPCQAIADFLKAVEAVGEGERRLIACGDPEAEEALLVRVFAVSALQSEREAEITVSRRAYRLPAAQSCPLLAHFGLTESVQALLPRQVWSWNGHPFAEDSAPLGLRTACAPDEPETLAALKRELALLGANSARWNKKLAESLEIFREARRGSGLMP